MSARDDLETDDCFVTVGWAYGLPESAVALCALAASGIPVHSSSQHLPSVASHWMVALGGIDLRVPRSLVPQALEILERKAGTQPRALHFSWRILFAILFLMCSLPPPASGLFARSSLRASDLAEGR